MNNKSNKKVVMNYNQLVDFAMKWIGVIDIDTAVAFVKSYMADNDIPSSAVELGKSMDIYWRVWQIQYICL